MLSLTESIPFRKRSIKCNTDLSKAAKRIVEVQSRSACPVQVFKRIEDRGKIVYEDVICLHKEAHGECEQIYEFVRFGNKEVQINTACIPVRRRSPGILAKTAPHI